MINITDSESLDSAKWILLHRQGLKNRGSRELFEEFTESNLMESESNLLFVVCC